jgi:VWFA-related protein
VPCATAQEPIIRVGTRLVQLDVIVRDKQGPVTDLKKEDFEVFDRGKPVKIAAFGLVDSRHPAPAAAEALPPDTFTNRLDYQKNTSTSATILLFDSLNTQFADQTYAREQLLRLLKTIPPQSHVALYALGNRLQVLHDFTDDPQVLARTLAGYQNLSSRLLEESGADGWLRFMTDNLQEFAIRRRVEITLRSLQSIANRLAGVPGRKNLIWISGGFPFTIQFDKGDLSIGSPTATEFAQETKRTAQALDMADVAVYPVNASGLTNRIRTLKPLVSRETIVGTYGVTASGNLKMPELPTTTDENNAMLALAEWTGGKAFYNTNDLSSAIRRAMEDAEATYTLGFYPEQGAMDEKYHEIRVKVTQKAVEVRSRKGYFATRSSAPNENDVTARFSGVVTNPLDATGIGLKAKIEPSGGQAGGSFRITVRADIPNLDLHNENGRWSGQIHVLFALLAADGTILRASNDKMAIAITDASYQTAQKSGLGFGKVIESFPGLVEIRVGVMDATTGNLGSLRIPVSPAKQ